MEKVRGVRALLRVWLIWPRPWAWCQKWELALGPGGWGALILQKIPQSPLWSHRRQITNVPRQGGRGGGPDVHVLLHLSTAKPLGIYLSLSVSGCARLCLCEPRRLCVCACLCLCMYLGLCLRVCGCWSMPVCMTLSGFVCVYVCLCLCALCVFDSVHVY